MLHDPCQATNLAGVPVMRAMVLSQSGSPLVLRELQRRAPGAGEVALDVEACGVCRTDLHVLDGELAEPKLPLILGHEIVGRISAVGEGVRLEVGARVGVPWLGWTCGACSHCRAERENLCDRARFTGYTIDGGYAEQTIADARYVFRVPDGRNAAELAPLLCAGLIGHRALRACGDPRRLGIYGFGAAAHLVAQIARFEGREVYAFTRRGDEEAQRFACSLGAVWAGASEDRPPVELDAAILFAPVGALVPLALSAVRKGGVVVCGGIHMSDIPSFPYALLWGERTVRSVANLTRRDGEELLELAARAPLVTHVVRRPLSQANETLADLRAGRVQGAFVLDPTT